MELDKKVVKEKTFLEQLTSRRNGIYTSYTLFCICGNVYQA